MSTAEAGTDFDATVAFYQAEGGIANPNLAGNAVTVQELARLGVGAVFARKETEVIQEDGAIVMPVYAPIADPQDGYRLSLSETTREAELGDAGGIMAVRARIATPAEFEAAVPVINGARARAFGSKWEQYRHFGEYMPRTMFVPPGDQVVQDDLDSLRGDTVIVKSDRSGDNRYNAWSHKSEVDATLEELRARRAQKGHDDKGFVVQEIESGEPITDVRPIFEAQRELLAQTGYESSSELRTHCFADRQENSINLREYPMLRVHAGNKHEVFMPLEAESVPQAHRDMVEDVTDRLLSQAEVPGVLVAVDSYGTQGDRLREINIGDPALAGIVRTEKDVITDSIRQEQGRRLAGLLARMAGVRHG